jgi:hypothetical protein
VRASELRDPAQDGPRGRLLFDFYFATQPRTEQEQAATLPAFLNALARGTPDPKNGVDPLGLYWPPVSKRTLREIIYAVTAFSDHCARLGGTALLNPLVPATFAQRVAKAQSISQATSRSLLKHIFSEKERWRRAATARLVDPGRALPASPRARPFFPFEQTRRLFEDGFRRATTGRPWEQFLLRDMMIAVLQRFGGLRASEPFHLYVEDVTPEVIDPRAGDWGTNARVLLHHPSEGAMTWTHPVTGELRSGTRAQHMREVHNRAPRSLTPWSLSTRGGRTWRSTTPCGTRPRSIWFPRHMGRFFWILYRAYIAQLLRTHTTAPTTRTSSSTTRAGRTRAGRRTSWTTTTADREGRRPHRPHVGQGQRHDQPRRYATPTDRRSASRGCRGSSG